MRNLFAVLLLTLVISSCGNKEPFDAETERLNLIDARENTMPIITEMLDARREVLTKVGNFNTLDDDSKEIITEMGQEMNEANNALVQWVSDFNRNIAKYMDMENGAPEQQEWMEDKMDELEDIVDNIKDATKNAQKISKKF